MAMTLNPGLTAAQPGWRLVEWPPTVDKPTSAVFYPVVAWGTVTLSGQGKEDEVRPVGVFIDESSELAYEDGSGVCFLGFSPPGDPDDRWIVQAIEAWNAFQTEHVP